MHRTHNGHNLINTPDYDQFEKKDPNKYRVIVLFETMIFTMEGNITTHDVVRGAAKARKMEPSLNMAVFYKGVEIIGNLQGLGLPTGARLEVKRL